MKWLIIIGGGLGALIAIIGIAGAMIPKTHVATVTADFRQPPAAVWAVVSDLAAWPSWNPAVKMMERLPDREGRAVWRMEDGDGSMTSEVVEFVPPTEAAPGRMVTRIADPDLPFGGSWSWSLVQTPQGSTVTIEEAGEIYNPFIRFIARVVMGYTGTAEQYLGALKKKLGESAS